MNDYQARKTIEALNEIAHEIKLLRKELREVREFFSVKEGNNDDEDDC